MVWFSILKPRNFRLFRPQLFIAPLTLAEWDITDAGGWSLWTAFSSFFVIYWTFSDLWSRMTLNKMNKKFLLNLRKNILFVVKNSSVWLIWILVQRSFFFNNFLKFKNKIEVNKILIITKKPIQRYRFPRNRFYSLWSPQIPSASVGVNNQIHSLQLFENLLFPAVNFVPIFDS